MSRGSRRPAVFDDLDEADAAGIRLFVILPVKNPVFVSIRRCAEGRVLN